SFPKTEEKEESKEEVMNIEIPDEQKIKNIFYSTDDKIEDTQKKAEQATTFSEAEFTTKNKLALNGTSFKDNNKENNPPQKNT
ncbi:8329_t:CDS:1, partial [Racocetra persica]